MGHVDRERVAAAVAEILAAIGEDTDRPGLAATPARVADAYADMVSGLGVDPASALGDDSLVDASNGSGDSDGTAPDAETGLVVLRGIGFRALCEHHLLPFLGTVAIAYQPAERLVGIGGLARLVRIASSRPTLQERLTDDLVDALVRGLAPAGALVVVEASHSCVTARGAEQRDSTAVTLAARGTLADPVRRAETVALIGRGL